MQLSRATVVGGRYRIDAPVSAGAMGAVYRATDLEGGRDVAIKQMLDRRHALRVEIEARVLKRLRHPRVVRFLDHLVDPDAGVLLVMDLVEGEDLEQTMRRAGGRLPFDEAASLACQAAEALHYVHGEQTVHRDVKPRNLVRGPDGAVLVDFGIAKEVAGAAGTAAIGTPGFMAPEVLTGAATPRSDVYGLAATLWTLLTGRPPRIGEAGTAGALGVPVPAAAERGLAAALEVDPSRRLPSVALLARCLGSPLGGSLAGASLAMSTRQGPESEVLEAIVRAAAGVLDAAAASLALTSAGSGLVYQAAWGAGAEELVGLHLPPGAGIAGAVATSGRGLLIPACRSDARFLSGFAERTGYVPNTMVVAPVRRGESSVGVLSVLDRRDGSPFGPTDLERAQLLADVAATALARVGPPTADQPGRTDDAGLGETLWD